MPLNLTGSGVLYAVVTNTDCQAFVNECSAYLRNGWVATGGLAVAPANFAANISGTMKAGQFFQSFTT